MYKACLIIIIIIIRRMKETEQHYDIAVLDAGIILQGTLLSTISSIFLFVHGKLEGLHTKFLFY